jgi:predicted CoA-binding protein
MSTEAEILKTYHTIAVVGLSPNPERPSNHVAKYMMRAGYKIIPVNPTVKEVLGMTSYPSLSAVPEPVEIVDVFRRSEEVLPVIDEAIKIKAKAIWLQEGVMSEEAAKRVKAAGLLFVEDR